MNKAQLISLLHLGAELLELQQLERSQSSSLARRAPPFGGRRIQSLPRIPPGLGYEVYVVCYVL